MTYKTENYLQQSIADFNAVLDNDYPPGFGEAYQTKMQEYVDGLSEDEIMSGNIRMLLTDKAAELANNVSSDNIRLSCEIDSIETY